MLPSGPDRWSGAGQPADRARNADRSEGMAPVRLMPDDPGGDWTLPGEYEAGPGRYRIPLPRPNDGLRGGNVYAVRDGAGLVMVDAGWALAEARELLEQAAKVLGSELTETRRFLV